MSFPLFFLLLSPSSAEEQPQRGNMHWASKTYVVVQSLSCVWFLQPHGLQHTRLPCHSLSARICSNSCSLSRWCHPTTSYLCCLLLLLPLIFPSIRVFSNEAVLRIRWLKYWSFSFSISPSSERSGLISFRMDWLNLLAVQGTLKSLLQQHSSKASILQYSAFFMVRLSHPYMTIGKTIALTRRIFVGKVMSLLFILFYFFNFFFFNFKIFNLSLLFNMLSRLVIAFLPRNKRL